MSVLSYIGLGANLGDSLMTLKHAIACIRMLKKCRLVAQSDFFRTAPLEAQGDDYTNAVIKILTELTAEELLVQLQILEQDFGRTREYHHCPRTLDLDILLYGEEIIDLPHLQVPHPRINKRAFVLQPLIQLNANVFIPGMGKACDFLKEVAQQKITPL